MLTLGEASKLAGRLSFSVSVSGNRAGKDFIKPFHAQAHSPMPGVAVPPLLQASATWFVKYLHLLPLFCKKSVPGRQAEGDYLV